LLSHLTSKFTSTHLSLRPESRLQEASEGEKKNHCTNSEERLDKYNGEVDFRRRIIISFKGMSVLGIVAAPPPPPISPSEDHQKLNEENVANDDSAKHGSAARLKDAVLGKRRANLERDDQAVRCAVEETENEGIAEREAKKERTEGSSAPAFPATRIRELLEQRGHATEVCDGAAVYLSAVLQQITSRLLHSAGVEIRHDSEVLNFVGAPALALDTASPAEEARNSKESILQIITNQALNTQVTTGGSRGGKGLEGESGEKNRAQGDRACSRQRCGYVEMSCRAGGDGRWCRGI
jgi:hypothetical protein